MHDNPYQSPTIAADKRLPQKFLGTTRGEWMVIAAAFGLLSMLALYYWVRDRTSPPPHYIARPE